MKWEKKGLIYSPKLDKQSWMFNSALTPTPILVNDEIIRVYFGARDIQGVSRIGYVDLNSSNPSEIIDISKEPVLDIGQPGCFDDNGVIPSEIIKVNDRLRLYYVGFQKVEKVKFLCFSGVAESDDGGKSFHRIFKTPVIDRSDEGTFFRAIHTVIIENGVWKVWCSVGNKWTYINNTPYPTYDIKYYESEDGVTFQKQGTTCFTFENDEYRLARPRVYKRSTYYEMFYTIGRTNQSYLPGKAISINGLDWKRDDESVGIELSATGWDSQTLIYPSLLEVNNKTYMFYNGNNMGADGFGYAESKNESS